MSSQTAKCFDCGGFFSVDEYDECPHCESSLWTPYDPDYSTTEDADDTEFSGSKKIDGRHVETNERPDPQPDVQELHIRTKDDWEYIFREPNPADGYELHEKRRGDGSVSDDDVVPVRVAEYIDKMPNASLNYAKLVVHPSNNIYTPPSDQPSA